MACYESLEPVLYLQLLCCYIQKDSARGQMDVFTPLRCMATVFIVLLGNITLLFLSLFFWYCIVSWSRRIPIKCFLATSSRQSEKTPTPLFSSVTPACTVNPRQPFISPELTASSTQVAVCLQLFSIFFPPSSLLFTTAHLNFAIRQSLSSTGAWRYKPKTGWASKRRFITVYC